MTGNIVIAVVKPDDWERPSQDLLVKRFELNDQKPSVLFVPAGHATASIMLTKDALLGVFSSETFERSVKDDFRFDITTWIVNV